MKSANKEFNTLDNKYELVLKDSGKIEVEIDETGVPCIDYNFVRYLDTNTSNCDFIVIFNSIGDLPAIPKTQRVNLLTICKKVGDVVLINNKAGNEFNKRELVLVDRYSYCHLFILSVKYQVW